MDSDSLAGLGLLLAALVVFTLVVAAEAGVIAGLRAQMQAEPDQEMSRLEVLRRYNQERQVTLSSLALARTFTLVGITAIVVFLMVDAIGQSWGAVAVAAVATVLGLMLFQALPRVLVSQNPERWSAVLNPLVVLIRAVFGLPARLIDLPIMAGLRWWRARHPEAADEAAELIRMAEMDTTAGAIDETERQMIRSVIELEQTTVKEVLVPRIDVVAVDADVAFGEVAKLFVDKGYSRLPVYEETIDNIIGVIFAKEVLRYLAKDTCPVSIRDITRLPYFVPESKKVDELLADLRQNKMSIAIVVDEYGGTAGLVTVEDLLEEIVGEIADEFDVEEEEIQRLTETEAIVDAKVSVDALNELFVLEIEKDDFETVGGFIYDQLGKMPSVGDEVQVDGLLRLRVLSMLGRRIKKVRVTKEALSPAAEGGNGSQAAG